MHPNLFDQLCRIQTLQKARGSKQGLNLPRLQQALAAGTYRPTSPRWTDKRKPDGGRRPIALLSAQDRLVSRAAAIVLASRLDAWVPEQVYAQRLARKKGFHSFLTHRDLHHHDRPAWDEKKWYAHFAGAARPWIERQGYRHVAVTDIAGYAENIDHQRLLRLVGEKIRDLKFRHFLAGLLRAWSCDDSRGLPQTYELTHLLANLYLLPLDHFLIREERVGRLRYIRFMDDLWTFSRTRKQAERIQREIRERLKKLGLSTNMKKTKIYETDEILAISRSRAASHA